MSQELISRDAAIEWFRTFYKNDWSMAGAAVIGLKSLPAVDAAPVVHSQWILHPELPPGEPDKECPECHAMSPVWSNYCHACGARMDAKQKEAPHEPD